LGEELAWEEPRRNNWSPPVLEWDYLTSYPGRDCPNKNAWPADDCFGPYSEEQRLAMSKFVLLTHTRKFDTAVFRRLLLFRLQMP
jgi:hypothetical protein